MCTSFEMFCSYIPWIGVEPYSKCPFSNHQSQQRIQISGYHISLDAVIRDKIFNTQNNEFFNWKKLYCKKNITEKVKRKPPRNIYVLLKILCCWKGLFCMVLRALNMLWLQPNNFPRGWKEFFFGRWSISFL